jgi:hypothetical protein
MTEAGQESSRLGFLNVRERGLRPRDERHENRRPSR